jgi:hypothetical protein
MPNAKNMLVAVDDSEASYRAVTYVGSIVGGREDCRVCLLHALPPLPRELLEFGGSSNPEQEEQEEARIKAEQARWVEEVTQAAEPIFTRAQHLLQEAHVSAHAVETQIVDAVNTQDLIQDILETAQRGNFGTIVVGRESFSGFKALFTSHVGDALIRQAHGVTVWVVE